MLQIFVFLVTCNLGTVHVLSPFLASSCKHCQNRCYDEDEQLLVLPVE
jgi:hypothetical protein